MKHWQQIQELLNTILVYMASCVDTQLEHSRPLSLETKFYLDTPCDQWPLQSVLE